MEEYFMFNLEKPNSAPRRVRMVSTRGHYDQGGGMASGAQSILAIGAVWVAVWAIKEYAQSKKQEKES